MKRKHKISIPTKVVLGALCVGCVAIMFVSYRYNDAIAPVKTAVGNVLTPMQKGINKVGNWIYSKKELLTNIETLLSENDALKSELDSVSEENKQLQQDKYELDSLRSLYVLDKKYASYPKVAARVIARELNNWYSEIKIDKGSDDGILVDMNVIAGEGLVGIVTEVGKNYSNVRLITDDRSNVTGMFLKTGDVTNIKGNLKLIDSGLINAEIVNKDAAVQNDDEIVTAYSSYKFLPGILIGYAENLTVDPSNMTKSGYLRPAVDFDNLDIVLIITQIKEPLIDNKSE